MLDENYNPKIYDYSFACLNANNLEQFVGTINYTAPEIHLHRPYDGKKCDIFSLGQLLFFLVT